MSRSMHESDRLCPRCESLDITAVRVSTGPRLPLGFIKHWRPDICALCSFLISILSRDSTIDLSEEKPYFLFSVHTRHLPEGLFQILDHRLIVLSTSENGLPPGNVPYITAYTNDLPHGLNYVQPSINFDQPRGWLSICTELHAEHCSGDPSNAIHNLRFIDCTTNEVVLARENDPYVALSYVWGVKGTSTQESRAYPKTIQDAIFATRRLGYRWLWVDQYCIDKSSPEEFHKQLNQMDVIYQRAAVTIIAAAGTNAHYGLPGVDQNLREPALAVSVGDEHLCELPKHQLRADNCKWISRAWTYQEGLLSTRRLVFTDDQLYFECKGCYCAEVLNIPLETFEKMHTADPPSFKTRYRGREGMCFFPLNGCGIDPWEIYNRISEYSERSLSHEYDKLNGMLGVFRAFERRPTPMRHLYGVPFPKGTSSPNETKLYTNSRSALPLFSESLRWNLGPPSKRRDGFPSWSWAGWHGEISWPAEYTGAYPIHTLRKRKRPVEYAGANPIHTLRKVERPAEHTGAYPIHTLRKLERPLDPKINDGALQVSVEFKNGAMMSWTEFQACYDQVLQSNELSGVINIEAYATPASYVPETVDDQCHGAQFLLQLEEGASRPFSALRTIEHDLGSQDTFLAIHFLRTVKGNQGRGGGTTTAPIVTQHLLFVKQRVSCWERVAIGSFVIDSDTTLQSTWQRIRLG